MYDAKQKKSSLGSLQNNMHTSTGELSASKLPKNARNSGDCEHNKDNRKKQLANEKNKP